MISESSSTSTLLSDVTSTDAELEQDAYRRARRRRALLALAAELRSYGVHITTPQTSDHLRAFLSDTQARVVSVGYDGYYLWDDPGAAQRQRQLLDEPGATASCILRSLQTEQETTRAAHALRATS